MTNNVYANQADALEMARRTEDPADEDPTPWCHGCGAKKKADCECGPLAENE